MIRQTTKSMLLALAVFGALITCVFFALKAFGVELRRMNVDYSDGSGHEVPDVIGIAIIALATILSISGFLVACFATCPLVEMLQENNVCECGSGYSFRKCCFRAVGRCLIVVVVAFSLIVWLFSLQMGATSYVSVGFASALALWLLRVRRSVKET